MTNVLFDTKQTFKEFFKLSLKLKKVDDYLFKRNLNIYNLLI